MRNAEQFQRKGFFGSAARSATPAKKQQTEPGENSALTVRELTFSEFMLASPLAGSELSFPRDFNDERYIQIQL